MVNIKELLGVTSQSCNTRERALGSLPANRAFNSDQVISGKNSTECKTRASWSGPKAWRDGHCQLQASSFKRQAFEPTCSSFRRQASSPRQQASSVKPQAASSLILEPWNMDIGEVLGGKGPRVFTMINVF